MFNTPETTIGTNWLSSENQPLGDEGYEDEVTF